MSSFDPDEIWWTPKQDRKAFVKGELARAGITLEGADIIPGAPDAPAKPLPLIDDRDGFFVPDGGTLKISPLLADQLHYRPLHISDLPEGAENEVDPDGYQDMMR